ncbi:hypothetical protein [Geomicrobium sp. JCM 19038]|uniref:hypothetical protein n=1 Tax=Geomicrobium sp. JCM 19038 TaxID=1460635 RepID=UPI001267A93C|nr:hypothetical protein [Geomicrobium sp. JCM 19038]
MTKDGKQYRVRLMRGAITDPSKNQDSDRGAHGSEWNRLMLPIHDQVRSGNWSYPAYVESGIPDWGIGFTDVDLVTHQTHGNGSYVLCQETLGSVIGSRIYRGRGGVSDSGWGAPSVADTTRGWAPVLELIQ